MAGLFIGGRGGSSLMWWAWMWVRWAWPEKAMVLKRAMREGIDNCFFLSLRQDGRTLKACVLRDVECSVCPGYSILGVASMSRYHLVEGGHAVTGLEFGDIGADLLDDASDVVAFIPGLLCPLWQFPLLQDWFC